MGLSLSFVKPGRLYIRSAHRRGSVYDEDNVSATVCHALEEGPCESRDDQGCYDELKEEKKVPSELLERCVRLDISDDLPPEERRRDYDILAFELEDVHDDYRAADGQEPEEG